MQILLTLPFRLYAAIVRYIAVEKHPFMAFKNPFKRKKMPGIIVKCQSGRFIAFYEHRPDIIANGENEKDARKNLRGMYNIVLEAEQEEKTETHKPLVLPGNFDARRFTEKM